MDGNLGTLVILVKMTYVSRVGATQLFYAEKTNGIENLAAYGQSQICELNGKI